MAQFDVHRNTGSRSDIVPFVVVVQSTLFDNYSRRVVIPLVKASAVRQIPSSRFNPTFKIGKTSVVLHPLDVVSVAVEKLGAPVASLASEGNQIIGALDELFSRAWG